MSFVEGQGEANTQTFASGWGWRSHVSGIQDNHRKHIYWCYSVVTSYINCNRLSSVLELDKHFLVVVKQQHFKRVLKYQGGVAATSPWPPDASRCESWGGLWITHTGWTHKTPSQCEKYISTYSDIFSNRIIKINIVYGAFGPYVKARGHGI